MGDTKLPAKNNDPENVAEKTADPEVTNFYLPAEWPKHKFCKFETLQTKRYADYSQADYKPGECPQDGADNTAKK